MSGARFTPGSWQRSGVRVKLGTEDCLQVGPDGFPISFLPIGKTPNEHAGAIADADLIAAAPDLYQAAEQFLASVKDGNVADLIEYYADIFDAAIAKAGGAAS